MRGDGDGFGLKGKLEASRLLVHVVFGVKRERKNKGTYL
jgi:hypothetical protein